MLDFVALDFETANKYKNSACSLAVITVENGQITKKAYSLIKPPFMSFDPECIEIHGIKKCCMKRHLINYGLLSMKII